MNVLERTERTLSTASKSCWQAWQHLARDMIWRLANSVCQIQGDVKQLWLLNLSHENIHNCVHNHLSRNNCIKVRTWNVKGTMLRSRAHITSHNTCVCCNIRLLLLLIDSIPTVNPECDNDY